MQWKNIKKCASDTIGDLVGKVEKRARKPWITQEMISKMNERKKWKNVNTEEGRRNYRRLKIELKRATEKARKEHLENICNEIMEICPASFRETFQCLKFPLSELRAQSRVSPVV